MTEGIPPPPAGHSAHNPLSINIEFNINNSRSAANDVNQYNS
jgi:hypothetical protein